MLHNPAVLNLECRLTQVELYNVRNMVMYCQYEKKNILSAKELLRLKYAKDFGYVQNEVCLQ